jgi:hypothetical protein
VAAAVADEKKTEIKKIKTEIFWTGRVIQGGVLARPKYTDV